MSTSYTLQVEIADEWIDHFTKDGWKLCMSFGMRVNNKKTYYNVIASTHSISKIIRVQWNDSYTMAASQDAFSDGATFAAATAPAEIKFKQSYTLQKDWTNGVIQSNEAAPVNGFRFINRTPAAAVAFRQVDGQFAPFYFSASSPLPPGDENMIPVDKIVIWFAMDADPATLVGWVHDGSMEIDMTGRTEVKVNYDKNGNWAETSQS